jgi:hypothetical protein
MFDMITENPVVSTGSRYVGVRFLDSRAKPACSQSLRAAPKPLKEAESSAQPRAEAARADKLPCRNSTFPVATPNSLLQLDLPCGDVTFSVAT